MKDSGNFLDELLEHSGITKAEFNAQLRNCAINNAAIGVARHAVLAIDLGIKVDRVFISGNDKGMLELQPLPADVVNKRLVSLVAMYMVGAHGCFPQDCCGTVAGLFLQAFDSHSSDDQQHIIHEAFAKSKELRTRYQAQIQAVAEALLNAPGRILSGEEVTEIMRSGSRR